MRMQMQLLFLMAAVALVIAAGCGQVAHRGRRGATVERLPKLEVVQPERKRLKRWLELSATVEALRKVDLSARVPGEVATLKDTIDIGRTVKEGDVLLRLAVPELEADKVLKEAMLSQARKQEKLSEEAVTVAHREVEETEKEEKRYQADAEFHKIRTGRIRELVKQRAQDPQVLEEATKQYEASQAALASNRARTAKMKARVSAAEADVELAQEKIKVAQADVKRLEEQIAFATVRAPFDGVLTRRWVDKGAIIKDPGAMLLTIMHIDRVRVLIDVPQRDVPLLNAREQNPNPDGRGDAVELFLPALAEEVKDGKFQGWITRQPVAGPGDANDAGGDRAGQSEGLSAARHVRHGEGADGGSVQHPDGAGRGAGPPGGGQRGGLYRGRSDADRKR